MKVYYDEISLQVSRAITRKYSTSFSLGIKALHPAIRDAIYAIYSYVRLADEIVDSFHDYEKSTLLQRFEAQTWQAIDEKISLNPVLQSFQQTVNHYHIDPMLIRLFLKSMEMDLQPLDYDRKKYDAYIVGSAEVVGLMCLQVFTEGSREQYEELKPYAMKLGSAFQKVNFLRDLKDDYHILGRTYFPGIQMSKFTQEVKSAIEEEIAAEFREAREGINRLPPSSRFGVYLAYQYYLSLFCKIRKTSAEKIINERIRVHNGRKLSLFMRTYIQYRLATL